jgi:hypothetical protein
MVAEYVFPRISGEGMVLRGLSDPAGRGMIGTA